MEMENYMRMALELAKKGAGHVNPNPLVGAVIVKDGRIIGQGFHEAYGQPHAEVNAINSCAESTGGADIYVTLEPCCHYGKNPPCTDAVIRGGFKRVFVGSSDPNPLVAGKGVQILRDHGIEVTTGVLKEECDEINQHFFHYIQTKKPFVIMKYAMTLDGKIATYSGKSQWITGEAARRRVHEDRNKYASIMVGVGTVIADDPQLTCRIENGRNPIRIICDSNLRTPLDSQIARTAKEIRTIIATASPDGEKKKLYIDKGFEIIETPLKDGHINLEFLMEKLGEMAIDSLILEGGAVLNYSALESGIVNKVHAYIAPKIFGGTGKSPVSGMGVESPDDAYMLTPPKITVIGDDILLESDVIKCLRE